MRKQFYNDILIIAVICMLVVLFFSSCRSKKEILETHIESRDSVCNIKESQDIVLVHEDSAYTTDRIDLERVDTGRVCIVKFNNIEIKDTSGTVTHDKSIVVYKKQNAGHITIDRTSSACSVSKDSAHVSIDSTATTEQHIDTTDQNEQKTDKGWNTWHTFWFWILILILLCVGLVESERKKL